MQPCRMIKGPNCRKCTKLKKSYNGYYCISRHEFIRRFFGGSCKYYEARKKKPKKIENEVYASREEELKAKGWIKKDETRNIRKS